MSNSLRKYGWRGFVRHAVDDVTKHVRFRIRRYRDHHGRYTLKGTPKGAEVAVVILAGYKPTLWPLTLERIRKYVPAQADVCVATAGKRVPELSALCARNGWTYLTTKDNKTGLALNKAIESHPNALRWFKLDEDVFVADGFFDDLAASYEALWAEGTHIPGFCAPMLNVNGVSYAGFLERIGASADYSHAFGEHRQAAGGIRAHYDPDAAKWLWHRSLPFDHVASVIRGTAPNPLSHARMIGTRFSIGAIYFDHSFWKAIGGFASAWRQGILGVDETEICAACLLESRPMFYFTHILAGHFSFYPQEHGMMESMLELRALDPMTFEPSAGAAP